MRTEFKHNPPMPYSLHERCPMQEEDYFTAMDISFYYTGNIIYETEE